LERRDGVGHSIDEGEPTLTNEGIGRGRVDLSAQDARQGRRGWPVVTVLVVSTVLVIVALAAIWLIHAPASSRGGGQVQVPAGGHSTPYMPARQSPQLPRPSEPIAR
jgi:hypothetical protein